MRLRISCVSVTLQFIDSIVTAVNNNQLLVFQNSPPRLGRYLPGCQSARERDVLFTSSSCTQVAIIRCYYYYYYYNVRFNDINNQRTRRAYIIWSRPRPAKMSVGQIYYLYSLDTQSDFRKFDTFKTCHHSQERSSSTFSRWIFPSVLYDA